MAFTQRDTLAERVTELADTWFTGDLAIAREQGLGSYIAQSLIADGWIVPEISEAESDGMIASILAIE